jgi:hypothetical protein
MYDPVSIMIGIGIGIALYLTFKIIHYCCC